MEVKGGRGDGGGERERKICFTSNFINLELCLIPGFHLGVFLYGNSMCFGVQC